MWPQPYRGTFGCIGDDGKFYLIEVNADEVGLCSAERRVSIVETQRRITCDGEPVLRLAKGQYRLANGVIASTAEPAAP